MMCAHWLHRAVGRVGLRAGGVGAVAGRGCRCASIAVGVVPGRERAGRRIAGYGTLACWTRNNARGLCVQQSKLHTAATDTAAEHPAPGATGMRTHTCGDMTLSLADTSVSLTGWMASKRIIGDDLVFAVLRDHYGAVQLKLTGEDAIDRVTNLPLESTIQVQGRVTARPADMVNPKMASGDVEVLVSSLAVLGTATNQPFQIGTEGSTTHKLPKEDVRLTHRPLDLRRPALHNAIVTRARVASATRRFLEHHGFLDIETPTLFKRTPGGAAEFLVPTQKKGLFYALVQSPQQYKQMLMVGGFDRYYQFARCYRDEGGRLDRQPEFTQIDLEMAFVTQEDVLQLTEALVASMWKEGCGVDIPTPFTRMSFHDAMAQYGSDKPDTRFDMKITDATDVFSPHAVRVWEQAMSHGGAIRGFKADKAAALFTRKNMKSLEDYARGIEGETVVFVHVDDDGSVRSSIFKDIDDVDVASVKRALVDRFQAKPGDAILLSAAQQSNLLPFLGKLRTKAASMLQDAGLQQLDPKDFRFLWVVDFPLFEPHELEKGRLQACHHPFTAPHPDDADLVRAGGGAATRARAQHFDVVVNGVELGGGSIRVHDPDLQLHILKDILHEDPAVFEQLLGALRYGAPPHGGIALGFDRAMLCMLAQTGAVSLRDTMAFPKSFAGKELMSGSPSEVPREDLLTYHVQTVDSPP
ncbi:hypothetical protein PTSG_01303 [Salpingoeca rosetta]|uniref:Aminoacyl-transfer RNA synthetases class-II family profile domain-containing protein n=1 Tax=Salpingoeca rosetta (strain ATCC 50818 / BSB-021) TaxID=946362 RepID=F2TZY5_SALR5|nr:uncharacterized protein PTSG_01303 [Salpingoeca rosetta]EGD80713.1 hypothetical protein PTSG_01303 [Salpingoeca rosetta]|eukprot:XP_004997274.1 hypothetical protein PTSG_01303 [Salpingoeca rosetta]